MLYFDRMLLKHCQEFGGTILVFYNPKENFLHITRCFDTLKAGGGLCEGPEFEKAVSYNVLFCKTVWWMAIFSWPPECNIELRFNHKQINVVILPFKSNFGSFQIYNVIIFLSWVYVSKTLQPLPQIQTENYETKAGQRQGNISSCKQSHVRSFPRNPFISPK